MDKPPVPPVDHSERKFEELTREEYDPANALPIGAVITIGRVFASTRRTNRSHALQLAADLGVPLIVCMETDESFSSEDAQHKEVINLADVGWTGQVPVHLRTFPRDQLRSSFPSTLTDHGLMRRYPVTSGLSFLRTEMELVAQQFGIVAVMLDNDISVSTDTVLRGSAALAAGLATVGFRAIDDGSPYEQSHSDLSALGFFCFGDRSLISPALEYGLEVVTDPPSGGAQVVRGKAELSPAIYDEDIKRNAWKLDDEQRVGVMDRASHLGRIQEQTSIPPTPAIEKFLRAPRTAHQHVIGGVTSELILQRVCNGYRVTAGLVESIVKRRRHEIYSVYHAHMAQKENFESVSTREYPHAYRTTPRETWGEKFEVLHELLAESLQEVQDNSGQIVKIVDCMEKDRETFHELRDKLGQRYESFPPGIRLNPRKDSIEYAARYARAGLGPQLVDFSRRGGQSRPSTHLEPGPSQGSQLSR